MKKEPTLVKIVSERKLSFPVPQKPKNDESGHGNVIGPIPPGSPRIAFPALLVGLLMVGCSGSSGGTSPGSGGDQTGGNQGLGGSNGGGEAATGGTVSTGGIVATGGNGQNATGGSRNTGGVSTGGNSSTGGSVPITGGTRAIGGSAASGGAPISTGGTLTTGGSQATGGNMASGGTPVATGGSKATGGSGATTGGTKATGGITNSGGNSTLAGGSKATGGTSSTGGSVAAGGSSHTGVWRVMPLGDSITEDTCYPQLLSKDFITGGHTNFVFVGSSTNNQSCGANAPSLKSEGHGGYLVCDLVGSGQHAAELMPWCTADQADMVFMHFGTNDCWGNQRTTTQILSAYTTIVGDLRSVKPNVIIFVAQIIPLNPAGCTGCDGYAQALNSQIPAWATGLSTAASPIFVVDMHSVFTPATSYTPGSTYTADGVHPNAAGAQLMADKMYAAISSHGYF